MNMIDSNEAMDKLIEESEMILVYFGTEGCGVCSAVRPKVEDILISFPKISSVQIDVNKLPGLAAFYNIFTIPGILIFIKGKETIREARNISIMDLRIRIERYYKLLFN